MKKTVLALLFCVSFGWGLAKTDLNLGVSTTHLLGMELETQLSQEVTAFIGGGGIVFPLPFPFTYQGLMVSGGLRYWLAAEPEGWFGEVGLGYLASLSVGQPFVFGSGGYRFQFDNFQLSLGFSSIYNFVYGPGNGLEFYPRLNLAWRLGL